MIEFFTVLPLIFAAAGFIGSVSLAPGVKRDLKEKWGEELSLVNGLAFVHRVTVELPNIWIGRTFSGVSSVGKKTVEWFSIFGYAILISFALGVVSWFIGLIFSIFHR
jgi:hypothetical protein